jgi:hypothetical protein
VGGDILMTLFKNPTVEAVWKDHWCARCWRDETECPILEKALRLQRKPKEWDRNARPQLMQQSYRCNEYRTTAPRKPRVQQFEDVPMFDLEDGENLDASKPLYVPVEGWPTDDRKGGKDVDHA